MKIYLVSRIDSIDYDQFDSFVIVANNKEEALHLKKLNEDNYGTWTDSYDNLEILEIGISTKYKKAEIILGSFNAG